MKPGMWQGVLAGIKNIEEKEEIRREKEEALLEKRKAITARLRPDIQENLRRVEEQRSMLTYLQNRKLSPQTLDALGQDPQVLQGAYEFASAGDGVDMSEEQLNDVYRATLLGDQAPEDIFTRLESTAKAYGGIDLYDDPEDFLASLPADPARTTAVEVRLPTKPKEQGVSETSRRTWTVQLEAFDRTIVNLAENEYSRLDAKKESLGLDDREQNKYRDLRVDIDSYGSSDASTERLKRSYGDTVLDLIESNENISPDVKVGLRKNPFIFNLGGGIQEPLPRPKTPEELDALPPDTEFIAPDGTIRTKI